MANFAARKWPECRILHHLSQGGGGQAPGLPAVGHLANEVAEALCAPDGPLRKYVGYQN
jgi:hypothetical protein